MKIESTENDFAKGLNTSIGQVTLDFFDKEALKPPHNSLSEKEEENDHSFPSDLSIQQGEKPDLFGPDQISINEELLQWWKGTVTKVNEKNFECELLDLQGNQSMATIEKTDVEREYWDWIEEGAEFAYAIYYLTEGRSRKTVDEIIFSPPKYWNKKDQELFDILFKKYFPEEE